MTAFLLFKIYIILIIIKYKKVALDMCVIPEKVTQWEEKVWIFFYFVIYVVEVFFFSFFILTTRSFLEIQ